MARTRREEDLRHGAALGELMIIEFDLQSQATSLESLLKDTIERLRATRERIRKVRQEMVAPDPQVAKCMEGMRCMRSEGA
jgi:hypothetical protein